MNPLRARWTALALAAVLWCGAARADFPRGGPTARPGAAGAGAP